LFLTFTYFVCFCCVTTLFLYINVYLSAHNVVLSLVRNPFDAVDISVGLSVEDPLYNQKRVYLDKSGRGATSVRFPLQRNRYNRVMINMIIYISITIMNCSRYNCLFHLMLLNDDELTIGSHVHHFISLY